MKSLSRRLLPLLLLPALVAAGCGSDDSSEKSATTGTAAAAAASPAKAATDTVKVAYIASPKPSGLEAWGVEQGIFQKELAKVGIGNVEFVQFPNGPDAGAAQASGDINVALVGDLPGVATKAGGIDTKLVSISGTDLDAWLLALEDGPKTVQDLAGKKVGVPKGSYLDKYLTSLLNQEGLTDKVEKVNLVGPDGITALVGGDVAANVGSVFLGEDVLKKNNLKIIDRAVDHPGLAGYSATTVNTTFADDHPGFAKAWNDAFVATRAAALKDPDSFYAFQADANGGLPLAQSADLFDIEKTLPEDQLSPENVKVIEATAQFLLDNKLQRNLVDVQDWILDPDAHGEVPAA